MHVRVHLSSLFCVCACASESFKTACAENRQYESRRHGVQSPARVHFSERGECSDAGDGNDKDDEHKIEPWHTTHDRHERSMVRNIRIFIHS